MQPRLAPSAPTPLDKPINLLICSTEPQNAACGFIRIVSPLRRDPNLHFKWSNEGKFSDLLKWADAVIIQRAFPTPSRRSRRQLRKVYGKHKPIIYEVDDYLFDLPKSNPNHDLMQRCRPFIRKAIAQSDLIITSTTDLGSAIQSSSAKIVLPNLLDDSLWKRIEIPQANNPIVIGYAGSPTHHEDLEICEDALFQLEEKHGDKIRFKFMGCISDRLRSLRNHEFIPFQKDYIAYSSALQDAGITIGIAPLADQIFNRSKSAIKWMEMSACGIAGVYSDLPPYRQVTQNGKAGLLSTSSTESWFSKIDELVSSPELRLNIAKRAQDSTFSNHMLSAMADNHCKVFREALVTAESSAHKTPPTLWEKVAALLP